MLKLNMFRFPAVKNHLEYYLVTDKAIVFKRFFMLFLIINWTGGGQILEVIRKPVNY